jgi:S-adenosylmethionine:tRNA ribosyltransferase-isomerase
MEWIEVSCAIGKKNYHLKDLKDYQDICDSSNTTVGCVMTDPKNISIKAYTYNLPEERIAKYPLTKRDASKLLIYQQGIIEENIYSNIATYIPANSLLIFNDTKVIEARLLFQKPTGGVVEIFCLAPHEQYTDINTAMMQKKKVQWQCLIGGASKWKQGQILKKKIKTGDKEIILQAIYVEKRFDCFVIELSWSPDNLSFAEVLHYAGDIPLPPYIKREVEESDAERYQTIYAHYDGSVAAPTAGLHFTKDIFEKLKTKNIQRDFVTLHVGAGTFKPVKSETMQEHKMHAEFIDISKETIKNVLQNLGNNIVAVGTTSLRTIESLYWLGIKTKLNPFLNLSSLNISQWEAYDLIEHEITVEVALQSLLAWMKKNTKERLITKTKILIASRYQAKIVKGLITNFHQPQSTLLLLVAAFIGEDWKRVYDYALKNNFRFLSYGDGSLLWRKDD